MHEAVQMWLTTVLVVGHSAQPCMELYIRIVNALGATQHVHSISLLGTTLL